MRALVYAVRLSLTDELQVEVIADGIELSPECKAAVGLISMHKAFPELTDREREILNLIAKGCNNTEIAHRFVLSPNTERNYVSNVFSKLQVADRAQAIIRARESGLGYNERQ
jgi:DNA-binding NarL/FixJ family response regulator